MNLPDLESKILNGERINQEEALFLYHTPNIHALGRMAETVRQRWNRKQAYYIVNRHINYSNVCIDNCKFCAFARKPNEEGGFTYSIDDMLRFADEGVAQGAIEFHVVGGLHPDMPYSYYLDMLRALKQRHPQVHLKCFTAVEISHLARLSNRRVDQVLTDLIEAGLGSLPGGGAEMFSERVRNLMCPEKLYVDEWLDVHRAAHRLGLRSNATMLYGHVERPEEMIDHMARLRPLQDETGGFLTFIPLHFQPKNTKLTGVLGTGMKDLRIHAVADRKSVV